MAELLRGVLAAFLFSLAASAAAADELDAAMPIRGFCIAAPRPADLDAFVKFIQEGLVPREVNTLILRVDYNYQYESCPKLGEANGLSKADVKRLVETCRTNHIQLIPQVNLLGHQSWANRTGALLREFPEFDETPGVKMPEKYAWPNPDGLYCKSYCPLHPKVHDVVFGIVDEICDAFESRAFHAGMDEVFYIGHEQCSRCRGQNKAALFAGEVKRIRDHLAEKNRTLWIWGDRLLEGKITGLGMWEASENETQAAVDLIPRDVVICDWHYNRPDPTPVYFALKGLRVVSCPWKNPASAVRQAQDMIKWRKEAAKEMRGRFQGMVQTVWSDAGSFLRREYEAAPGSTNQPNSWNCFKAYSEEVLRLKSSQ